MISAFTRIMLALAMAFVFAGQMEAAAAHCARLAQADVAAAGTLAAEADCHGMNEGADAAGDTAGHHEAPAPAQDDQAPPDHCECIGALKVCTAPASIPGSTTIAAYAWLVPETASFASIEPAPGLRPPRA